MNISYRWLKKYIETDLSPEKMSGILTDIGLEVESLEEIETVPGGLKGLLIGEVLTCVPHENADRLRVTTVNIGENEPVQIVCGAPNVATGQKVVVATVGAMLYPSEGEPFQIKKSKIRGEVSIGMICAEDEIGLGQGHDGIMVLDADSKVGTPAADFFNVETDFRFTIGLTPNRADAASHLGVARDLAAFLKIKAIVPNTTTLSLGSNTPIKVKVENGEACIRYTGVKLTSVKVGDSPDWLKNNLLSIGLKPINNVVDITNYVLHELGQPLHAFDAQKIEGNEVLVKTLNAGTKFTTLDEVERELHENDLMICSAKAPMCIAGVFGGIDSGVTATTTEVFLESAYFHPVWIRKAAKRHGMNTDASFRFERGTDPNMTVTALQRAVDLLVEIAGAKVEGDMSDFYPNPVSNFEIELPFFKVDRLIGHKIDRDEICSIFEHLEMEILERTEEKVKVSVPPYRVDVQRDVDLIEDVLRIVGFNSVPMPAKMGISLSFNEQPNKDKVRNLVSDFLSANGFQEVMSNSLTSSLKNEKAGILDADKAVKMLNPLSNELDILRQNLLTNGLESLAYNINRKQADLKIYEFGKTYFKNEDKFKENQQLLLLATGKREDEQWNASKKNVDVFYVKAFAEAVLEKLGINPTDINQANEAGLEYGGSLMLGPNELCTFGRVSRKVTKAMEIKQEVFMARFDWDKILKLLRKSKIEYKEVAKFPAMRRDLSMLLNKDVSFNDLHKLARKTERKLLQRVNVFDVYQGDKLPDGKKSYALGFVFMDENKTLKDKQIDAIMDKMMATFESEAGAEIRK